MPNTPLVFVDLYETPRPLLRIGRWQPWRWRALNGENYRVMANSAEAYTNIADALLAIQDLFGVDTNVYLRQHEQGNQLLRLAAAD